jgi:hypothetical protein
LVLVLVLSAKTLALTVVGLSLAATTELDLVPRVVRLTLLDFDERLQIENNNTLAEVMLTISSRKRKSARQPTMVDDE